MTTVQWIDLFFILFLICACGMLSWFGSKWDADYMQGCLDDEDDDSHG